MNKVSRFSYFAIIYNPNSTGNAPEIAKNIRDTLKKVVKNSLIELFPTDYAGHAIELAAEVAANHPRPLIISVSGDGGYNEVVNGVVGVMQKDPSLHPVVTVIGAGNANDHYRVVHKNRSITAMLKRDPEKIDLLRVAVNANTMTEKVVYAHSYIGIGITPLVAEELNRNKLNLIKEAKIILTALLSIRPTRIEHHGKKLTIDSLVFANISQMAKVLTLTDDNSLHDGQFEVIEIPHTNIFGLLRHLIRAATTGLKKQPKRSHYSFTLLEDHPLQIDGEVIACRKGDSITVDVAKDAVMTLR